MANPANRKKPAASLKKSNVRFPVLNEKLEKWCFRQRKAILIGIIILSAVIRLVYFLELNKTHLVLSHLSKETDMYVFDEWARAIEKGDLLSQFYVQPEHYWMRMVSEYYFRDHPDKLAEFRAKVAPDTSFAAASRLLWAYWYGERTFPHEPLYTYFVALSYTLSHNDVRGVFFWQLLIGLMTNILIWLTTRRLFGDFAGLIAAMLAVFCGPMLFYELVLLRSSMACFFTILVLYLTLIAMEKNTFRTWVMAGIACGLAMMVHTFFILFLLGMSVILLFIHRKSFSRIRVTAGGLALGFFLIISPVMIRNGVMNVGLMTMSNNSVIGFISMNDKFFPGSYIGWSMNGEDVNRIMGETDGSFFKTLILTLKTHPSFGSYLVQVWGKFQASFSWFEIPNNVNFYFYREQAPILFITFVSFLVLSPLALAGIILAILNKIKAWPLYMMFLVMLFPLIAFMVLSRYRIPFAVVLIPFAALSVSELFSTWSGKKNWLLLLGTGILAYWSYLPRDINTVRLNRQDYETVYIIHYSDSLKADNRRQDWKKFIVRLDDYIHRYQPSGILDKKDYYKCKNDKESGIFTFFSFIHQIKSQALFYNGDTIGARIENTLALKLKNATD